MNAQPISILRKKGYRPRCNRERIAGNLSSLADAQWKLLHRHSAIRRSQAVHFQKSRNRVFSETQQNLKERTMNTQALMTRMTPRTLASFIADLDNAPGDYDAATLYFMQAALETLFGLVGRADAMALLSEYDVTASNPLVEAMVESA